MNPLANLALALMAARCMKQPPPTEIVPAGWAPTFRTFLKKASDAEIRDHAIELARRHLREGTPYVAWCGMVGLYRPGISSTIKHLVAELPALNLPSGCLDPLALKGAMFALAYNGELVKHLPLRAP